MPDSDSLASRCSKRTGRKLPRCGADARAKSTYCDLSLFGPPLFEIWWPDIYLGGPYGPVKDKMYWPGSLKSAPGQCLCRGLDFFLCAYTNTTWLPEFAMTCLWFTVTRFSALLWLMSCWARYRVIEYFVALLERNICLSWCNLQIPSSTENTIYIGSRSFGLASATFPCGWLDWGSIAVVISDNTHLYISLSFWFDQLNIMICL